MSGEKASDLHLPDLSIRNFRGINKLMIGRLGRVTLLTGRNGVGKTTVLEAVRVYAARGRRAEMAQVLSEREEFNFDEDNDSRPLPDYSALFYGRTATRDRGIRIGPSSDNNTLDIQVAALEDLVSSQGELFERFLLEDALQIFKITFNETVSLWPWYPEEYDSRYRFILRQHSLHQKRNVVNERESNDGIRCLSLGPGLPDNDLLADSWDNVVLTDAADLALDAAQLADSRIKGVAMIGDNRGSRRRGHGRRVIVKIKGHDQTVPLKSLGDGLTRLFAAAVVLANCKNGFLLIDEVENGIHYSVENHFWDIVIRAAKHYNVQVIATTHSYDCIKGFARAATAIDDVEGRIVRLDRKDSEIRAVEYTEEELKVLAAQNIEVR